MGRIKKYYCYIIVIKNWKVEEAILHTEIEIEDVAGLRGLQ